MPEEKVGETVTVETENHPARKDSPAYTHSREWLMGKTAGGCYVCGGPVDLSHPEDPADKHGMQDHHGGGIFLVPDSGDPVLVGFNLFGTEWSLGWGADPARVAAFVGQLNEVTRRLGGQPWTSAVATTDDVMAWVDSPGNANVKLCVPHHVGFETKHTPDVNGHEAVGIHEAPFPIWLGQATCDWARFDMWGGTTGTVAVGHPGDQSRQAVVLHVSADHGDPALRAAWTSAKRAGQPLLLPGSHPIARSAHRST